MFMLVITVMVVYVFMHVITVMIVSVYMLVITGDDCVSLHAYYHRR